MAILRIKDETTGEWVSVPAIVGPPGGVDSVNGQQGDVVLDAEDVGALPDDTVIPSKTSDLTNNSGFVNAAGAAAAAPVQSVNGKTGAAVLNAADVGAVENVVETVAKDTYLANTTVFPGGITVKRHGRVIEFYCAFNSNSKPTAGTYPGAVAPPYWPAAPYALLLVFSGTDPYLQCGTMWIYPSGQITLHGIPNGTGYIRGVYLTS